MHRDFANSSMNEDLRLIYGLVRRTRAGVLDWFEELPSGLLVRENSDFAFGNLARIYSHIAETYLGWIGEVGLGEEVGEVRARDAEGIRSAFKEVDATVQRALLAFEAPDEPFEWHSPSWGTLTLTKRWLLLHPITHEFHHKGQALALARLLGHPHPGNPDTDLIWPHAVPER